MLHDLAPNEVHFLQPRHEKWPIVTGKMGLRLHTFLNIYVYKTMQLRSPIRWFDMYCHSLHHARIHTMRTKLLLILKCSMTAFVLLHIWRTAPIGKWT